MSAQKIHLPSLAMLLTSGCGMLLALGGAVVFFLLGIVFLIASPGDKQQSFTLISVAWISGLVALLVLPSALFSLFRLLERPFRLPGLLTRVNANYVLILWPLAIGAGFLFLRLNFLPWLVLPPLEIVAIGVPILWLVWSGRRGLEAGPQASRWKLFSFTLLITTPTIILVELIAVGVFGFVGLSFLSRQPGVLDLLRQAADLFSNQNVDPQALQNIVARLLKIPGVVFGFFFVVSGIAPLVEEPLKTLGVWLLYRDDFTPARGLVSGAVCGAAFTLLESLGVLNSSFEGATWTVVMLGRTGTAVMHIFTAGLTGWGIASLASQNKFGRILLAYLTAMTIHALWNFLAIASGLQPLMEASTPGYGLISFAGQAGMFILAGLMALLVIGIFVINRRLRPAVADLEKNDVE